MALEQLPGHCRLCDTPPWLTVDWILSVFSPQRKDAIIRYRAFIAEGKDQPRPWEKLQGQLFLGSESFIAGLQGALDADVEHREIPSIQRRPIPQSLDQIPRQHERDEAIARAYASGGYSLKQIGDHSGLHYSRVSRIVKQRRLAKGKI